MSDLRAGPGLFSIMLRWTSDTVKETWDQDELAAQRAMVLANATDDTKKRRWEICSSVASPQEPG